MSRSRILPLAFAGLSLCILTACGTSPAPDFRGRWKPANAFAEQPQPIPLSPSREFIVSPADATLKATLERWSAEAGLSMRYDAPVDYTLHAAASSVAARDLPEALRQMEAAYGRQALRIRLDGQVIRVSAGDVADVSDAPSSAATSP